MRASLRSLTAMQYTLKLSEGKSFKLSDQHLVFESEDSPSVKFIHKYSKRTINIGNDIVLEYSPNRTILPTKYIISINKDNSFYHEADPIIGFTPNEITNGTDTYKHLQNDSTNWVINFNQTECAQAVISKNFFKSPTINLRIMNPIHAPMCILFTSLQWELLYSNYSS